MATKDPRVMAQFLKMALQPWHDAVASPAEAQEKVLKGLLVMYARNNYGMQHGAGAVSTIADYRRLFPVITYEENIRPMVQQLMAGEIKLLLDETPITWARTRNTTGKVPKFIPVTPTELRTRLSAAPRANMNYVASSNRYDIFGGVSLNLHYPSVVGKIKVGDKELEYGYCSGIDAKHTPPTDTTFRFLPNQDEIDALGGENTDKDWEARFELAYQKCKDENATQIGGATLTVLVFGKYLKKVHRVYPKDIWKVHLMTLGSVPGTNTRYQPALTKLYGDVVIREIYGATEGMFGQQRDEYRAWVPNYDLFFFEVQVGSRIKMLHEMRPGEIGSLIVSTPILPRYKIGDLIKAYRPPYFRCIGRERWWTPLYHFWNELTSLNLDRL